MLNHGTHKMTSCRIFVTVFCFRGNVGEREKEGTRSTYERFWPVLPDSFQKATKFDLHSLASAKSARHPDTGEPTIRRKSTAWAGPGERGGTGQSSTGLLDRLRRGGFWGLLPLLARLRGSASKVPWLVRDRDRGSSSGPGVARVS